MLVGAIACLNNTLSYTCSNSSLRQALSRVALYIGVFFSGFVTLMHLFVVICFRTFCYLDYGLARGLLLLCDHGSDITFGFPLKGGCDGLCWLL